jgi:hypothetical protein
VSGKRRPIRPAEVAVDEHARQMFIGGLGGSLESPRPIDPDYFPSANFLGSDVAILFKTDEFTLTSSTQYITLTFIPMNYSEHVYLHNSSAGGTYKEEVVQGWTREQNTKNILITSALGAQAGDVVVVSYAYKANQPYPEPVDPFFSAYVETSSPNQGSSLTVDMSGTGIEAGDTLLLFTNPDGPPTFNINVEELYNTGDEEGYIHWCVADGNEALITASWEVFSMWHCFMVVALRGAYPLPFATQPECFAAVSGDEYQIDTSAVANGDWFMSFNFTFISGFVSGAGSIKGDDMVDRAFTSQAYASIDTELSHATSDAPYQYASGNGSIGSMCQGVIPLQLI